jgi:hypothetical protein
MVEETNITLGRRMHPSFTILSTPRGWFGPLSLSNGYHQGICRFSILKSFSSAMQEEYSNQKLLLGTHGPNADEGELN